MYRWNNNEEEFSYEEFLEEVSKEGYEIVSVYINSENEIIITMKDGREIVCIPNNNLIINYRRKRNLHGIIGKYLVSIKFDTLVETEGHEKYRTFYLFYKKDINSDEIKNVSVDLYMDEIENQFIDDYDFRITINRKGDYASFKFLTL